MGNILLIYDMTYPSLITIHSFTSFDDFSCSKKNKSDQELKCYCLNRLGYRFENYKKYCHIINLSNMTKKETCTGLTEMKLVPLLSPEISCWEAFSQCTNKWDKVTGWLLIVQYTITTRPLVLVHYDQAQPSLSSIIIPSKTGR